MFSVGDKIYQEYVMTNFQAGNNEQFFNNFRHTLGYYGIVENAQSSSHIYLNLINNNTSYVLPHSVWEELGKMDLVGGPIKQKYRIRDRDYIFAPLLLKYVYYTLVILEHSKLICSAPDPLNIVEIGCSFGGFCKVFLDITKHFNIQIQGYYALDLEPVANLASKCVKIISQESSKITCGTLDTVQLPNRIDFVISNHCFCEITSTYRFLYRMKILEKSPHGFMAWNDWPLFIPRENVPTEIGHSVSKFEEECTTFYYW